MTRRKWTKEEIKEYRKTHGTFLYCNKEDSNFFVPKVYGFGGAFNWANPISWVFALAMIGFIVLRVFFK